MIEKKKKDHIGMVKSCKNYKKQMLNTYVLIFKYKF